MIHTDRKIGKLEISGTGKDIEIELIGIITAILHDVVIPIGDDPMSFMARVSSVAITMSRDEELHKGTRATRMIIPKERSK